MTRLPPLLAALLLFAICAVLFLWRIGATPLIGLDEALYAESAREMSASGNWILPTYNAKPLYDKPPLAYWLMGACMRVFGVNSFAARLPSALAALALVALTSVLGSRIYGRRAGILAGFVLACTMMTTSLAHMAILDMLFALTITTALAAFLLSYLGKLSRWGYLVCWAATGLSLLVKGPVGAMLVGATVLAFVAIRRKPRVIWKTMPVVGLLLMLAISVPWYVLVQRETGGTFAWQFFVHQNIERALGKDFHHNMPFYFYLPVFLIGFFPWSVFIPAAWSAQVRLRPQNDTEEASLFAAVWIVAIVALFSIARSKLPAYIYPMYPAAALLVGAMWSRAMEDERIAGLRKGAIAALVVAVVIAATAVIARGSLESKMPGMSGAVIAMTVSLVIGAAGAIWAATIGRSLGAFAWLAAGNVAFLLVAIQVALPVATEKLSRPQVELASKVRSIAAPGEAVLSYNLSPQQYALAFYAQRPVEPTKTAGEIAEAVAHERPCLVIAQEGRLDGLPEGGTQVLKSGRYVVYRYPADRISARRASSNGFAGRSMRNRVLP